MGLSSGSSISQMGVFLLFAFLVLPSVNSEEFEYRKEDLPPVLLVPGLGGSQLLVHYINQPKSCPDTDNMYDLLYVNDKMYLFYFKCILECLAMTYDNQTGLSYSNPNVDIKPNDWGALDGINSIDSSGLAFYMRFIGLILEKHGYQEKFNLFGTPYDFRFGPHQQEPFFTNLTELIETTVEERKSPVVLVAHSMGAPLVSILLNRKSAEWRKKHVDSMVTLSGAWGGAVSSVEALATGPYDYKFFKPQVRFEQSVMYMLPDLDLWDDNDSIMEIENTSYSMKDIETVLKRLNLTDNVDMYRKQARFHHKSKMAPQVPLHCLYGDKVETLELLSYKDTADFPDSPVRKMGNGDGTVNHKSLDLCSQFDKHQSEPVYVKSIENADHRTILFNKGAWDYLVHHVLSIANNKTTSLGETELGEEGVIKTSSDKITDVITDANRKLEIIQKQQEANRELMRHYFEEQKDNSGADSHLQMRQQISAQLMKKLKGKTKNLFGVPLKKLNRL